MKLFYFLCKSKLRNLFHAENLKTLIPDFMFSMTLLFYFSMIASLMNQPEVHRYQNQLKAAILGMFFLVPIFLKFIPSFRSKSAIISFHYPVSKFLISLIDLILFSFLKLSNIALVISIILYSCITNSISFFEVLNLFQLFFSGFLFAENFVNSIHFGNKVYKMICIAIFILFSYCIISFDSLSQPLHWSFCFLIVVQLLLFFHFYNPTFYFSKHRKKDDSKNPIIKNVFFYVLLLLRTSLSNITLLVAFGLKISLLAIIILFSIESHSNSTAKLISFMCISSIFPFTYIFNNLWGFLKSLTINYLIAGSKVHTYLSLYLKLLFPILVLDFCITSSFLLITNTLSSYLIYFYFLFLVYAIFWGIVGSFIKPVKVPKTFSLKSIRSNTSQIINFFTGIGIFFFYYCYSKNLYSLSTICALVAVILIGAFFYLPENFSLKFLKKKFFQE